MIKCACNNQECKTQIRLDSMSRALWFTDKDGNETLMYLDPNTVVKLIEELRDVLLEMACGRTS